MKKYGKYIILALSIIAIIISICFVPINASSLIPTLEEQVTKDLGINIHIEKLILRFGPHIKVKAPLMHLMYEDGQKFAQFNNVKFYLSWSQLFKQAPKVYKLQANKLTVRVNSDDKYLPDLLEKLQKKDAKDTPNLKINDYHIAYLNRQTNDKYSLIGSNLETSKFKKIYIL